MEDNENVIPLNDKPADNGPTTVPQPPLDVYFTGNENVISDLLFDEIRYHSFPGYCVNESLGQAIWMRRALLNWLREVCEHRNTEPEVLAHTAQLIDRFVRLNRTDKRDYQLVGSACFLISSKLKETIPVSVERMVQYTDFSVTKQDLLAKEVVISLTLEWDFVGITPLDFIHPVTSFLPCDPELRQLIRNSAVKIFMKILHVDEVNANLPAYTAANCILYALQLTVSQDANEIAINSTAKVKQLLRLDPHKLRVTYLNFCKLFEPGSIELSEVVKAVDRGPPPPEPPKLQPHITLIHSPPPIDTSTPTYLNQPSSSSTCSVASSASAGHSTNRPSYLAEDSLLFVPPTPPKNVYAAGQPLLVRANPPPRILPNPLATLGVCTFAVGDLTSSEQEHISCYYCSQLTEVGLL